MSMMRAVVLVMLATLCCTAQAQQVRYYPVTPGDAPHDVAPAPDGTVWYTAQAKASLGILDPKTGKVEHVALGRGSAPHGVIAGPDGAAWITDSGLNAIVRVDPKTRAVRSFPLHAGTPFANLNTAAFDGDGILWYTGQSGYYGSVNPKTGEVTVKEAPRGRGPYGITATPSGDVWFVSLAGNYLAKVDRRTGAADVFDPPTPRQGARRVWSDSKGRLWISEWNSGNLSMYDPAARQWRAWKPHEDRPRTYSVWVDERDMVWITEWQNNSIYRFDPVTQKFQAFESNRMGANVRQMLGRPGEAWGAESGTDRLVVVLTR